MTLPFTRTSVHTTALTHAQLTALLGQLPPTRKPWQVYAVDSYAADLTDKRFVLRHADPQYNLPAMPKITGEIREGDPTTIRLTIAPNYFILAFLLLFPVLFIPAALFSDDWTINGVHRAPVLSERLSILLMAGGMPLLMGYMVAILPVQKAQAWIVQKLALQ